MSVYEISLLAVGINTFLNYSIGKPGPEFSPYEIFSFYTVWLSKNRLKKTGLLNNYLIQLSENCKDKPLYQVLEIKKDFDRIVYNSAEPFFTWERMVGMCSICTGFWISLITGICFTQNFVHLIYIVVISHVAIRLLNKFL